MGKPSISHSVMATSSLPRIRTLLNPTASRVSGFGTSTFATVVAMMMDGRFEDVKTVYLMVKGTSSLTRICTLQNYSTSGVSCSRRSTFAKAMAAMVDDRVEDGKTRLSRTL